MALLLNGHSQSAQVESIFWGWIVAMVTQCGNEFEVTEPNTYKWL